jgi:PAS domain S-box-containing protein
VSSTDRPGSGGLDQHEALRALVEGTAAHTGERFFAELVRNLARVLDTHGAWITEYLEDSRRLRALSFWLGDQWVKDYEYDIAGTPCEPVIDRTCLVHFPENVVSLFPNDPDLAPFGAVSYMGVPFTDHDGRILGHLAVLDTKPMPEEPRTLALFQIFANRAAAELRRLRLESKLREREQELGRLVDSAMDAIIELDPDLRVTLINGAGEKVFGCRAEDVVGAEFHRFLTASGLRKLEELIQELESLPEGRRNLWIAGGLDARLSDGEEFPAEATLSRFEMRRGPRYTLILRNVNDRLQAERRIRSLTVEAEILREQLKEIHDVDDIIGKSEPLMAMLRDVRQVAGTDSTVLILGETGTGKELIARAIHAASVRKDRPLITVNCAAIPLTLIESEFFGHEKGAFTGATAKRDGRFALADGGTIFLDEVGDLPLDVQAKLLRVLQEGEFEPVGSSKTRKVDVRVIAATNRDLKQAAGEREFREDLYYRLNVFPIRSPSLKEREGDVALLAEAFAQKYARRMGRTIEPLSDSCIRRLEAYSWPGNVRELQNVIERAVITSRGGRLDLDRALSDVPGTSESGESTAPAEEGGEVVLTADDMRALERRNLIRALEQSGWRVSGERGAACLLGMKPTTLASRMKALGIKRK